VRLSRDDDKSAQSQKIATVCTFRDGGGFCLKEKALSMKNSAFVVEIRRLTANERGFSN
jgi:hypothetical protein